MHPDLQIQKQRECIDWINAHFAIKLRSDRRSLAAQGCFDLAIEHHSSICLLFANQCFGSMFALARPLVESYVRGLFLFHCATETEIERFESDSLDLSFKTMVDKVEAKLDIQDGPLSALKANSWKHLNSMTHSGFQHVVRRYNGHQTGAVNYSDRDLSQVMSLAGALALSSALQLALLVENQVLAELTLSKMREYAQVAQADPNPESA